VAGVLLACLHACIFVHTYTISPEKHCLVGAITTKGSKGHSGAQGQNEEEEEEEKTL